MTIPEWTFGDRLRKARAVAGLDQRQFAERLSVKAGSLATWETDRARPRDLVAIARRVELLTGIPAAWVLGVETQNPRQDGPDGGGMLPRLDSNQQPSGCESSQVSGESNARIITFPAAAAPAAETEEGEAA